MKERARKGKAKSPVKARVVTRVHTWGCRIWLTIGTQHFLLDAEYDRYDLEEARWYANQLRKALKKVTK